MMDPMTAIGLVASALGIIDMIADQFERFAKKEPEPATPKVHSVLAKQTGDKIEFVDRQGTPVETITADEMKNLDPQSQQLIKALEASMKLQFDLWTKVYPQRETSPDPVVNAKIDAQLESIAKKMCGDLKKILTFLEGMGKNLTDHYDHIQFICSDIESSQ